MPEYLPPINYGPAEQLYRQMLESRANRPNPIAALMQGLNPGLQDWADQKLKQRMGQGQNLTPDQTALVQKGLPNSAQLPGQPLPPGTVGPPQPRTVSLQEAFPKGVPRDLATTVYENQKKRDELLQAAALKATAEYQKTHTPLDDKSWEQLSPKVRKDLEGKGFKPGDLVPNRILEQAGGEEKQKLALSEKESQFQTRRWDQWQQGVDRQMASGRGVVSQAFQNNMRSRRAAIAANDPKAIQEQLDAAFADYASIMKGGYSADQESMRHMRIDTMAGKWAKLKETITSKPQEVNTPEVQQKLRQMLGDVISVDDNLVKHWLSAQEKGRADILKNPEYKQMWDEKKKEILQMTDEQKPEGKTGAKAPHELSDEELLNALKR